MYEVIDRSMLGRGLFTITLLNCKILVNVYPDHYKESGTKIENRGLSLKFSE